MKHPSAILVAAVLAGVQLAARAEIADGITAIAHDSVITYQQVENLSLPFVEELKRQYRDQPAVFDKKRDVAVQDAMERLVENQVILHDFESSGLYNLPQSIIEQRLQETIRTRYNNDRVAFTKTLQAEGKTLEQYRREFREDFIITEMRYVRSESARLISPHKIEVFYLDHQDQFKQEEQVKLSMILLSKPADEAGQTRKLAEEILLKIKGGAAFAEMASVYSQGSERTAGGARDWEELSKLKQELREAAVKLKVGQVGDLIETSGACYLIKLDGRQPAHVRPLGDVRVEIEKALLARENDRVQKQWLDRLKRKTFVRYF
jgi:peptidyl-prolyl cis-trans isomerase SurA